MLHLIRRGTLGWQILALCIGSLGRQPLASGQTAPPEYPYAVFELPTLGGPHSYGWGLDDRGNVVGSAVLTGNDFHPTAWIDGQEPVDLGTLGGRWGSARGINNNGWIIGGAQKEGQIGNAFSAFLWRNGEMINLGYLNNGVFAEAYGINDHNQIVGWAGVDDQLFGVRHAFLWQNGVMSELPITSDYMSSEAIAINNSGLIVGQAASYYYMNWRPVIWQNGQVIDLGTFREDNDGVGICIDCNEAGNVVGYTARDYRTYRAFVYHDGAMIPLPEKQHWTNSYAWSINDNRQIVGGGRTEQTGIQEIGCIWDWDHPGVEYLGELIPPRSNWFIGLAIHNNDAGQITGTGYRLNDPDHTKGYLLTPVHPTMELSQAAPGAAGTENTLTLTGATPGAHVVFLYGRGGGGAAIPGCTLQTNCLQIESPRRIGSAIADAEGNASITAMVPIIARGQGVLFQAVVQDECAVSQLVVQRFE